MDWLKPQLLWGLAGLALPVAVHLIGRYRRRKVRLATVRFLEAARARASARIRLRQILLLLARMCAVALLALLFAGTGLISGVAGGARSVVLVVDNSPSMAAARGGETRLDTAKRALGELLDAATPEDRFAVLTTGAGALVEADPFTDRLTARMKLSRVAVQGDDAGLPRALELAGALLAGKGGASAVVATDLQKYAWRGVGEGTRLGFAAQLVDVGFDPPANAWIEGIEASGGGVRVRTAATGAGGAKLAVGLELDDGRKLTSFVSGEGEAHFHPALDGKPRLAKVTVSPGGDLAGDDAANLALTEAGPVRVLLVNGDPKSGGIQDELHFLRLALASGGRFEKNFDVREVGQADLTGERAAGFDVVLLANPGPVSAELAQSLSKLVAEGLGLVVTAGDRWSPERADDALGLLSAAPLRDRMLVGGTDPTRPPFEEAAPSTFAAPFAPGGEEADDLRGSPPRASGYWVTDSGSALGAKVLMRLANQIPLLVARPSGKGRLLLLTTSVDRDWSDWCLRPSFVPTMEKLLTYAAGRTSGGISPLVPVGGRVLSPFAAPVEVKYPDSASGEWLPGEGLTAKLPGFYRVTSGGRLAGGFEAVGDPRESDLTRLTGEELKEVAAKLGVEVREKGEARGGRRDLSPLLGGALLAALAAEALLSARRSAKRKGGFDVEAGEGGK